MAKWDETLLLPCGTAAAYRRHLRNGQTACPECKRANTRAKKEWRLMNEDRYREHKRRARKKAASQRLTTNASNDPIQVQYEDHLQKEGPMSDPIADTEFDGAVDRVDAANRAAQLGGTESEIAADSVGDWEELGYNKLAKPDEIVKVLGEENRDATVTVGSLKSATQIPDSGWNDAEYWPPFDSVNRDSFLAGGGNPDDYQAVAAPQMKPARIGE